MSDSSQPEPQEPPYYQPPYPHQDPGDEDDARPNDPEWRERYRLVEDVITDLRDLYEDGEAFAWLVTPHPQLKGQTPIDAISDGYVVLVAGILRRLQDSVYQS